MEITWYQIGMLRSQGRWDAASCSIPVSKVSDVKLSLVKSSK